MLALKNLSLRHILLSWMLNVPELTNKKPPTLNNSPLNTTAQVTGMIEGT